MIDEILHNVPQDANFEVVKTVLKECLAPCKISDEDKTEQAERWISWAKGKHNLKIVRVDVPAGILPPGCDGQLSDVKVSSGGPDDVIYDRNKDIRDKVARGNCFLTIDRGPYQGTRCVTYALKKFTGGLGDDDDKDRGDNFTWKQYFLKSLDEARTVVCTKKANGEAAHFSARKIGGQIYTCIGSKNVHMLMKTRADIDTYVGERYSIAKEVCNTVYDLLEALGEEKQTRLLEFLCHTEFTGVFEILNPDHAHVENFAHMTRAELRFITWTTCDLEPALEAQLCTMPPHVSIEIARALGLPTVAYEVIPSDAVDERMKQVRQGYGYEGEVLYFLDEDQNVIGLLKKKTIWYILCRAVREKLKSAVRENTKNHSTFNLTQFLKKVIKRVDEIQKWLGLDDESTVIWKNMGTSCLKWVIHQQDQGHLGLPDIADQFPVTWQRFLDDTRQTDRLSMMYEEPEGSDD